MSLLDTATDATLHDVIAAHTRRAVAIVEAHYPDNELRRLCVAAILDGDRTAEACGVSRGVSPPAPAGRPALAG